MLEHLSVRDFALIDSAEVDFSGGLVLFTGETGAGKSLIVGAIGFLFGGRADSGVIREGSDECMVSAVLDIAQNKAAMAWLSEHDIPEEEGILNLRRGLRNNGRSYAYIQNRAVSRADLADFTSLIADIHGQHEHQTLLDKESHLAFLDNFAGLEVEKESYRRSYESWTTRLGEYKRRLAEAERREREQDILSFVVKEIHDAKIKPDEDDDLIQEERILSQHEKLFDAVKNASEGLSLRDGDVNGAVGALRKAKAGLDAAKDIDGKLADLATRLESAFFEVDDIAESVSAYMEGLKFDPRRLEEIESRLAELKRLKKKYGPSLADVFARAESDAAALEAFSSWKDDKADLEKEIAELKRRAIEKAETLSGRRKDAAVGFSAQVEAILARLGMSHARLPISIAPLKSETGKMLLSPKGMDDVEFLIAPNLGEPPKPLAKIASGGELSRVALAIKAVLSSKDTVDTLIFDEIDTGIGGEVAADVGSYLKGISRYKQVLCVTHLASIAAKADIHYRVDKKVEGGRTVTRIDPMVDREREEEIARMLAGDSEGAASLAHAAELLRRSSKR
ncbi:MAG TPA: DNA repair protein RecN [Rectinemataceae bacterium]|nr:DNA repair protein RecN [Rectinemataceae bacterium]